MVRAVPEPSVCTLLDVDAGLTAMALPMIGRFEPFDQPGIEAVAGEEIARHRAAPIVRRARARLDNSGNCLCGSKGAFAQGEQTKCGACPEVALLAVLSYRTDIVPKMNP